MMNEEKSEKEIQDWFVKDLLPRLITEGRFPVPNADPKDLVLNCVKFEETEKGTDHFASTPYFMRLILKDSKAVSRTKEFRLIVKFITQNLACRNAMETDVQFYNEMIFYNEVLPTFEAFLKGRPGVPKDFLTDICPVCRYAHIDLESPDYGIVIMDDLREEGYACAVSKVELDLNYIILAVQKLAKLHAVSYAMKLEKVPGFHQLTNSYKEVRYQPNKYKEESMGLFHQLSSFRALDYLLSKENSEVPKSYLNSLKAKIQAGAYHLMQEFIIPKEPLAVICHGDFCRNNILFRFENGRPIDSKLFDYQTWRYASPAIDLSFFIYMNTTLELREKHFDEVFKSYYQTLVNTVSIILSEPLEKISQQLPFESFQKDFGDHALYGYCIIAFFLPMMMAPLDEPLDFEDEWSKLTFTEMAENNAKQGGERVTQRIAEVVIDMYRRGFYSSH